MRAPALQIPPLLTRPMLLHALGHNRCTPQYNSNEMSSFIAVGKPFRSVWRHFLEFILRDDARVSALRRTFLNFAVSLLTAVPWQESEKIS